MFYECRGLIRKTCENRIISVCAPVLAVLVINTRCRIIVKVEVNAWNEKEGFCVVCVSSWVTDDRILPSGAGLKQN